MSDDEALAAIEKLYDRLPSVECKGLCADSCGGAIHMSDVEHRRIVERTGIDIPQDVDPGEAASRWRMNDRDLACPALVDERCTVHDIRPFVCRAWGAGRGEMACKHGCKVTPIRIKSSDLRRLLNESYRLGGSENIGVPAITQEMEDVLEGNPHIRQLATLIANGQRQFRDDYIQLVERELRRAGLR
jgi:hypothetical protein